jgi:hypothetical protein
MLPNTLGTSRTFENLLGTDWELDGNKEELENKEEMFICSYLFIDLI